MAGRIGIGEASYAVHGTAWLDREWSTSALADDQVGWDWFALQLSDGRDLMFYQLRRRDGSSDPFSAGALVGADGVSARLGADEVEIEVLGFWESPRGDAVYPSRWRLRVPGRDLDLTVSPILSDQELDVTIRYWEGASAVRGTAGDEPVSGVGYVELTGYASRPAGDR